jgi:cytochrome c-type biogenesis protein CcmH/NrfG
MAMTPADATEPSRDPVATPDTAAAGRRRTRRFVVVVGAAAAVAVAAALTAVALNGSSGGKPADSSANAALVAPPGTQAPGTTTTQNTLPPLAIVLDRKDSLVSLPAADQVVGLRARLATRPTSTDWLDLGQVYMALGDQTDAHGAFARAASLAHNTPDPLVGLAMTAGMSGAAGLARANATLTALAVRFPTSQVVMFNLGWLAVYRTDVATIRRAWARTAALGPTTDLGSWADVLLKHMTKPAAK